MESVEIRFERITDARRSAPGWGVLTVGGPFRGSRVESSPAWRLLKGRVKISYLLVFWAGMAGLFVRGAEKPFVFNDETRTRQDLVLVSLGQEPADLIIRGAKVLNVFTHTWSPDQDIVIKGKRIAWVGPEGQWTGKCTNIFDAHAFTAVPGFGEPHIHIESSLLTPEYDGAMSIPYGVTWSTEGSHEFSNVNGAHNIEFWLMARKAGSPFKIFPALGSATPPTAYESGGGYYGYSEVSKLMDSDPWVVGLDEVMDMSEVWKPGFPGHDRIWQCIQSTEDKRGVVEGHGAGLFKLSEINAFAAAGLSSDHELKQGQESWEKLSRGVFLELRVETIGPAISYFLQQGIQDWSNVSVTTDDRNAALVLKMGAQNLNIKTAIDAGAPVEAAYCMASFNVAKHWHIDSLVGSIAPGRYADVVLLDGDPKLVQVDKVFCDGQLAADHGKYLLNVPKVAYPDWATKTMELLSVTLPVKDGVVERDGAQAVTKAAIVDRYKGRGLVSKMFRTQVGPKDPDSAISCSVNHDLHNIWVLGSSDAAMAMAVNEVARMQGGWALVKQGKIVARVPLEIGGLMSARPAAEVAKDMENLWAVGDTMEWYGQPGVPREMIFGFITCTPFNWVLVAPYASNPGGLVNVATGQTHSVVW
jgi:adenine deaminase